MSDADEAAGIETIARSFVEARRAGRALPDYPGAMPGSLATAYAIQDRAIALRNVPIAGWKVGRVLPPLDMRFGTTRLAGPIFADTIRMGTPDMPVFADGFAAVEAEFLFQLDGAIDPAKQTWSIPEALDRVRAVHVGVEIASSPFPGINGHGPCVTISDFGNNYGLIVGAAIENWRGGELDDWTVTLAIDDQPTGTGCASAFPGGSAESVRFLLENLAARGISVAAGSWVSTGAVTGVHEIKPGQRAVAVFGERFDIVCGIVAADVHAG